MNADVLDRPVEHHLRAVHLAAFGQDRVGHVAAGDRAVELAAFTRLADDHIVAAVDLLGRFLGPLAVGGIAGLDVLPLGLEDLEVGFIGPERLGAGQQIVAGEAVLDVDDLSQGAETFDALEQDDLHGSAPHFTT